MAAIDEYPTVTKARPAPPAVQAVNGGLSQIPGDRVMRRSSSVTKLSDRSNIGEISQTPGAIHRSGNHFSDQAIAGSTVFGTPGRVDSAPPAADIARLPADTQRTPGVLTRAATTGGIGDLSVGTQPAHPIPAAAPSTQTIADGIRYDGSSRITPLGGGGNQQSIGTLPVSRETTDIPRAVTGADRVSGGPLTGSGIGDDRYGRIDAFLKQRAQERADARARQAQALAASTMSENRISARNELQNAARNARIDSRSLRLTSGGRAQRQLLDQAANFTSQAAAIQALPPDSEFIRSPEQEAALAQGQQQNQIFQQEADARTLSARAQAARTAQGPQETFGNPTDERDASGRPIRVQYGDQGSRRIVEGAQPLSSSEAPKLTEQQSKDFNYYTRASEALKNLGEGKALTSYASKAGASVPVVGNALAGNAYQKQEQAGREFLAAVLRKDSGANITKDEFENYGKTFLPQPGDSAETLKQKAMARQTALRAIKLGMGPAQQLVPEQAGKNARVADAGAENPAAAGAATAAEVLATSQQLAKQRQRRLDAIIQKLDQLQGETDYSHIWE